MIADLVRYRQQQGNMNVWQTLHRAARVSVQLKAGDPPEKHQS